LWGGLPVFRLYSWARGGRAAGRGRLATGLAVSRLRLELRAS
jgi:hypothetical protein